jgi:hypothetical protein
MLDEEKKEEIANYVLDRNHYDRLKLTIEIHDAFDTIRTKIIRDFCQKIVKCLESALPAKEDWSVDAADLKRSPTRIFTGIGVRRKTWDEELCVRIEAEAWGPNGWIIGIQGKESGYQNGSLRALLNEKFGCGHESPRWPWYHFFDDRTEFRDEGLGNWTRSETLIAMHDGAGGEYSKRICERIIEIARVVDCFFKAG